MDLSAFADEDAIAGLAELAAAECQINAEIASLKERAARERTETGRLVEMKLWREAVAGRGPRDAFKVLLVVVTPSDVDDLIALCGRGTGRSVETEPELAAEMLADLVQRDDPRFHAAARARWAAVIGPRISDLQQFRWKKQSIVYAWAAIDRHAVEDALLAHVSAHGLHGRYWLEAQTLMNALLVGASGAQAKRRSAELFGRLVRQHVAAGNSPGLLMHSWIKVDRASAGRFLTREWPGTGVDDTLARVRVFGLAALGTAPAKATLLEIREAGGAAGERATAALELLGAVPPEGLRALAARWRTSPSRTVLKDFVGRYVEGLPTGVPMAEWGTLVFSREPEQNAFAIQSPDGGYLFLELDRRGRLVGWKFD